MATVDERVAFLEGRVNEQSQMINGIRDALVSLEQRMDRQFESLEQRLNALDQKVDAGFAGGASENGRGTRRVSPTTRGSGGRGFSILPRAAVVRRARGRSSAEDAARGQGRYRKIGPAARPCRE